MSAPYTELERPLDEYTVLCRGCLAESGEMKNIFEWGLAEDFFHFTNIQLSRSDNMSELLCTECESILLTCKQFRQQCQKSDSLLRNTAKKKSQQEDYPQVSSQENTISYLHIGNTLKIYITAPDMNSKIYIPCPNCEQKFIKKKDLLTHLVKTHNCSKNVDIELQYYCNDSQCTYFIHSGNRKYFKERKFLNQHYTKVHMEKCFQCEQCKISLSTLTEFQRHLKTCNITYLCQVCNISYNTNEKLLVHLLRKHPDLHKQYKNDNKALKRKSESTSEVKKTKTDAEKLSEFFCDSPKRSSATQTFNIEDNIKNDVTLPSWHNMPSKSDTFETKTDEISTQTVFEDLISLKSQTSEDDSIFFSETVSLSDIQTQTFPLEFGLSRSNKETITSETQSPDLSIKETQTCFCLYDSPKLNFRIFDSVSSSPSSLNLTSTETQTSELKSNVKSDVLLSFNSAETQTSFEENCNPNNL